VLMQAIAEFALQRTRDLPFEDPPQLQEQLLPEVEAYARQITRNQRLRKTFVLNALVALDNAAWMLYARQSGCSTFDEMLPDKYRVALSHRHRYVASIPTIAYGTSLEEMVGLAERGHFVVKVKLGQAGGQREMLEKDKRRIEEVHAALAPFTTEHTTHGRIHYYFDINGRYESKALLMDLLHQADRVGALDRILLLEEPFAEGVEVEVSDLGVRVAADEGAHTHVDTERLIQMGYGAIALKPIAKTLSMTLRIANTAHERGVPCFCADLTVNPILVDWNKSVAARLAPVPGLEVGLLETNGPQNYRSWDRMVGYHPAAGASWIEPKNGMFELTESFYEKSGGILEPSDHYLDVVRQATGAP
jgi:L-alanine-DL-glutamate epimerase-like enolase superfamily enzyme